MTRILNLTQHEATLEQIEAGVVEPQKYKAKIIDALTFETIPCLTEIYLRAAWLAGFAKWELEETEFENGELPPNASAMIAGAPYLMSTLEQELIKRNIKPVYAFSERISVDETLPDGRVKTVRVFKHLGFVEGGV